MADNEEVCPCTKKLKTLMLICKTCHVWWHAQCVGLTGLKKTELQKLKEWECPLCYRLPEAAKQECSLETISQKLSDLRSEMDAKINKVAEKVEKKTEEVKKWSDLFTKERDSDQVTQVVKKVVEQSKQRMDSDHMEREKRVKNIVLNDLVEPTAESNEDKKEEDKTKVLEILGLRADEIEFMKRAGKPRTPDPDHEDDIPRPRPLIVTVLTPEVAQRLHNHGRGRKFTVRDEDDDEQIIWCNPDLIAADRKANWLARKERNKRRQEAEAAREGDGNPSQQTRNGSFLEHRDRR